MISWFAADLTVSPNVLGYANLALERMDPSHHCGSRLGIVVHPIPATSSTSYSRLQLEPARLSH